MQFSEVPNSQSERSSDVWPIILDDRDLLREFGIWESFTYSTSLSFSRSMISLDMCLMLKDQRP
jgi:hypothetical protein